MINEIMQDLTEEEKEELLLELEDHRKMKQTRARVSSISAAQDMRFTMQTLAQGVFTHSFVLCMRLIKIQGR
jgi:hypothetical protein